ncbi:hypothetical protein SFRURICE_005498 [Spodoptera frugiperda]|nr:hypothetical protein SFRURICE_005498 [Spodoptera frugiperda]
MSEEKTEVETFFGRCRCCLTYGYLKNMWLEHKYNGNPEIYGEMLAKCFALTWDHSEDSVDQDQICEDCIIRLRDAYDFKKVVLDSQEELTRILEDENQATIKEERLDEQLLAEHGDDDDYDDNISNTETEYITFNNDTMESIKEEAPETEYTDIEYLEDEVANIAKAEDNSVAEDVAKDSGDSDSSQSYKRPTPRKKRARVSEPEDDDDESKPKRKWPPKLPKSERHKTYKQYSETDLRKCLEEVRSGSLTPADASLQYNIPKKTICAKLKMTSTEHRDPKKEQTYQLIKEIKAILTFTNATPYKSKNIRYYCAYCSTDGPHFEDPDDLRTHTRTEHVSHRIEKIEYTMRPYWMNEVIKLDIDNLLCTVCCVVINNWNDMFKHLRVKHRVLLDQAYTRVIPYVLRQELNCALCKEHFTNYLHLDAHMNAHYNNYVCDDCGDTFLAENRLKQHVKIHNVGKFPCKVCDKVFALEKYRRKHEELVHEQALKFKCLYCDERFAGEYLRHLHCLEKHRDKIKIITCELCGESFTWKQYYTNHMRKKHERQKQSLDCRECDKTFLSKAELKEHLPVHKTQGDKAKAFECNVCQKQYVTLKSFKQHVKTHEFVLIDN